MRDRRADDLRRAGNPLYGERKLKLGTFGTNLDRGCAISTIDGVLEINWPNTLTLAKLADEMEFEALVPVGRWKGFGGVTNFNGPGFETFSWAAGVGACTQNSTVFATSHVLTVHPIMAAKQATTIDHITGGRFALNVVTGWHRPEMEMFGAKMLDHDDRYALAVEWLEIIQRLWTAEEEFDYDGKHFKVAKGYLEPKPLQKPFPPVMNAGSSETGRDYAAKYCDIAFVNTNRGNFESNKALIESYRKHARQEYGRELQIWSTSYIVQGETEQEAKDYLRRIHPPERRLGGGDQSDRDHGAEQPGPLAGAAAVDEDAFHRRLGRLSAGRHQGAGGRRAHYAVKPRPRRRGSVVAALH